MEDIAARTSVLREATTAGGDLALRSFRQEVTVETKAGPLDEVTDADRDAQARVVDRIRESYPTETILAEEDRRSGELPADGCAWVLDPIDGTTNYAAGNRIWATCLACVRDGEAVAAATYLPALGDLYVGVGEETTRNDQRETVSERSRIDQFLVGGIYGTTSDDRDQVGRLARAILSSCGDHRSYGSGQSTLAMVAGGELDAAVAPGPQALWDTIAGVSLVRRAGGRVTDLAGEPWTPDASSLVASNGHAHRSLLRTLSEFDVVDES
jgi:myo-inositol-1(or 4)-monophosphatase